jgi:hypothetical protein
MTSGLQAFEWEKHQWQCILPPFLFMKIVYIWRTYFIITRGELELGGGALVKVAKCQV